ncbi:hypothetical protein [Geotalea toluenoxydans]
MKLTGEDVGQEIPPLSQVIMPSDREEKMMTAAIISRNGGVIACNSFRSLRQVSNRHPWQCPLHSPYKYAENKKISSFFLAGRTTHATIVL